MSQKATRNIMHSFTISTLLPLGILWGQNFEENVLLDFNHETSKKSIFNRCPILRYLFVCCYLNTTTKDAVLRAQHPRHKFPLSHKLLLRFTCFLSLPQFKFNSISGNFSSRSLSPRSVYYCRLK